MLARLLQAGFALVLFASQAIAADRSYTDDAGVRQRGLEALLVRVSETRPLARLLITPNTIEATAQADTGPDLLRWTVSRLDLRLFNLHQVTGPIRMNHLGVVEDQRSAYFRYAEAGMGYFDSAVAAAIAHAQLETRPQVESVEIARAVSILPEPSYGDVRWTVKLRAEDETAIVYLSTTGAVIGADLSDTERARRLDLYNSDDWPMAEAQRALAAAIGASQVHEVRLYEDYVFVNADHPTDASLQRDYAWRIGGVTRGIVDTPNLLTLGLGNITSFDLDEIDFTLLPQVKRAAREAFDAPDAVIIDIEATKPLDRASEDVQVLWQVEFREPGGEEGEVWLDAEGKVVEVKLPESRQPDSGPWLAPETVIQTIRRIGTTFGEDAKISEITISDIQASIDVEDPRAPGEVAQFLMDAREVTRFGSASLFASLDPGNVFTPGDLKGLTPEALADMVERTRARLEVPSGEVFRYTFSRHALIMEPSDNRLMVEIRYGQEQGSGAAGWMTFLLDGTQTDQLLP